jgi:hypothetical protein
MIVSRWVKPHNRVRDLYVPVSKASIRPLFEMRWPIFGIFSMGRSLVGMYIDFSLAMWIYSLFNLLKECIMIKHNWFPHCTPKQYLEYFTWFKVIDALDRDVVCFLRPGIGTGFQYLIRENRIKWWI